MEQFYNEKVLSIHLDKLLTHVTAFLLFSVKLFADAQDRNPVSCSNQVAPNGGYLQGICVNARPNDGCRVGCYSGYYLFGTNPIYCRYDGTWSASLASCRGSPPERTCPPLSRPRGGYLQGSCSYARTNEACRVVCNSGHTLVGNNPIVCRRDGTWTSARPSCARNGGSRTMCPTLPIPDNGNLNGTCAYAFPGDTCLLSCSAGYVLSGSGTLICLRNGSWDKAAPQCEEIICEDQDPVLNGVLSGDCAPGKAGEECTLVCANGYSPSELTITCQDDSTWSDELPDACTKKDGGGTNTCRKLIRPPNGYIVNCNRNAGGICTFRCNAGFVIYGGPSVRRCQANGQWTGRAPTCVRRLIIFRPG